ncbi:MAG: TetR family transcriptional regulator [Polaromonas sp.]
METPVKHARRSKQPTETRQAGLVEAALLLAAQRSPADITTGDLARAVGITQGAVFRHFASKEAVWLAALDWTAATLMTRLQAAADAELAAAQSDSPLAALRAVFLAHVDFMVAHPGVPRVVFQELQHAQDTPLKLRVRGLLQQYRALLTGLLQRAQAQGLLAPGTDLAAATVLFVGSVQGLLMQALISGDVGAMAGQAPGVFAIYLRGLAAPAPANQALP